MPIHDWSRVNAGTFHHFHQTWIIEISRALNAGRLPAGFYAMAEQIAGGWGPDVLTLEGPDADENAETASRAEPEETGSGSLAIAERPPKVRLHSKAEVDLYARKATGIAIRHSSDHRVVAMIEIVSPGNKSSGSALAKFIAKAEEILDSGVHLMVIDLIPPGNLDPQGMHGAIWKAHTSESYTPPPGEPLTLASYIGGDAFEVYVEPLAVGASLIDMPLFLSDDAYVPAPLEMTYKEAFAAVPAVWRKVLEGRK